MGLIVSVVCVLCTGGPAVIDIFNIFSRDRLQPLNLISILFFLLDTLMVCFRVELRIQLMLSFNMAKITFQLGKLSMVKN